MIDDEGAGPLRAELDHLAAVAPAVGFTARDVIGRGRRRRQLRRVAAVGGTAAALAVVVAVPTAVVGGGDPAGPVAAGASRSAAPGATATPRPGPTTPPAPRVPGLTPAEADRIARGCALSYGGRDGVPGGPAPSGAAGPAAGRLQDSVRVHNLVRDSVGVHALVYGPYDLLSCDVGESAASPFNAAGASGADTRWLPGPVSVDQQGSTPGGPAHSGENVPVTPGYDLAEGRVSPDVARVEVRVGADRKVVTPLNGTYVARFVRTTTWEPDHQRDWRITAYDRGGRVLATVVNMELGCWLDPSGEVVFGRPTTPRAQCKPALRWAG